MITLAPRYVCAVGRSCQAFLAGAVTLIPSPPTSTNLVTGKVILTLGCFMLKTSTIILKLPAITFSYLGISSCITLPEFEQMATGRALSCHQNSSHSVFSSQLLPLRVSPRGASYNPLTAERPSSLYERGMVANTVF